jgi:hypothetical protein
LNVVFVEATNEPRPRGQPASELFDPPFEEAPLGFVARQLERALVLGAPNSSASGSPVACAPIGFR